MRIVILRRGVRSGSGKFVAIIRCVVVSCLIVFGIVTGRF